MKIGDQVTWKSQAGGRWKEKTGKIIAILKPEENARPILEAIGITFPSNRVKFQSHSELHRAIVEVPRGGRSKLTDYYSPRITQLKKVPEEAI